MSRRWNGGSGMGNGLSGNSSRSEVSGRRDSNPRPSAWEADALPLSYSRVSAVMAISSEVLW
jgi:hypothetical protein